MNGQINNPKAEIKFVKCIVFGGSRCICAGTSDSRVLLWKDGQFGQISIPYPYALSGEAVFRKAAERLVLRHASRGFVFTLGSGQALERGGYSFTLNHTEK